MEPGTSNWAPTLHLTPDQRHNVRDQNGDITLRTTPCWYNVEDQ